MAVARVPGRQEVNILDRVLLYGYLNPTPLS